MHDATKQLNALAGDHKESPLGEHEIALRGSRSADQSGRIKCEERPVACIIQVIHQGPHGYMVHVRGDAERKASSRKTRGCLTDFAKSKRSGAYRNNKVTLRFFMDHPFE